MLFHVEMDVRIPPGVDKMHLATLKESERARLQELQREGTWRHLWRVAGRDSNVSIFDVETVEALDLILSSLPLFPYMEIKVTPICRHPLSIRDDDR